MYWCAPFNMDLNMNISNSLGSQANVTKASSWFWSWDTIGPLLGGLVMGAGLALAILGGFTGNPWLLAAGIVLVIAMTRQMLQLA